MCVPALVYHSVFFTRKCHQKKQYLNIVCDVSFPVGSKTAVFIRTPVAG